MRVYLPCTLPRLREVLRAGEVAPGAAFAVTPALREHYREGDAEELEYVALTEAARASLALLDAERLRDPAAAPRRVVLAADADADAVAPVEAVADRGGPAGRAGRADVRLTRPVPLRRVVSAHVDDAAAEAAVASAAEAVVAAELGSEDAKFALDEAEGHELLWWSSSELELLVLDLP
jgi:hypothetical protein